MMKRFLLPALFAAIGLQSVTAQDLPQPSARQLEWQQLETTAFIHFTVNTYTGKEWGDGTESPSIFNPKEFDADKLVKALKKSGFKWLSSQPNIMMDFVFGLRPLQDIL